MAVTERALAGRDYLRAVVDLLQRARTEDPVAGVWEAADLEWWWRKPRSTDHIDQPFWFEKGRPIAAAIATDWGGRLGLDIITLPAADSGFIATVAEQGAEHAARLTSDHVESLVDDSDELIADLLTEAGFLRMPDTGVSAWMGAADRPPISSLADGYRLATREELADRPHHYIARNGPLVEQRLRETSLYRPALDLAIVNSDAEVVADGLFWHDPTTSVGFVEPMGTEEDHRRRGLGRHVLTAGLELLASLGVERLKINYESNNPASATLYQDLGFSPTMTTAMYVRRSDNISG